MISEVNDNNISILLKGLELYDFFKRNFSSIPFLNPTKADILIVDM